MKNLFLFTLICAFALVSCSESKPVSSYFTGEIAVVNDTVLYYDNATGRYLRVNPKTKSLQQIKENYNSIDKGNNVSIFTSFKGELSVSGKDTLISIEEMDYFGNDYQYDDDMYFATTYRNEQDMELMVLMKDYTYVFLKAHKDDPTKSDTTYGTWSLAAADKIVIKENKKKAKVYTVMPMLFNSLINGKQVYTPTYEDQ